MDIRTKRVYDPPSPDDGTRVLVDRLWPRGVRKDALPHDEWLPDVAPSPALRRDFHHDRERFDEFRTHYLAELDTNDAVAHLRELARTGPLTLLYAARDTEANHAVVLREALLT